MHTAAPRNRATASLRSRHKLKQAFKAQHRLDVLEQLRKHMAGMVAYADRWPRAQA